MPHRKAHAKSQIDDVLHLSLRRAIGHRLPWLLLGLLGGILAAEVIDQFEAVLQENLILAAFIPLIVYMADAVGTQMEAFVVRDQAMHPRLNFPRYFFKQFRIVFVLGILVSVALLPISLLITHDTRVSVVVSLALFFGITSSVFTGLIIPHVFNTFRVDPANASGPIATIIQDLMSVMVYFLIASWLL